MSELLGDKEAIADLNRLYQQHPEMFENMKDVSHTIKEVVSNPEIIEFINKQQTKYESKTIQQTHTKS
ncbi:hypothetical protein [Helicobacter trogontum]|uniref:hypothetical protein n=1 Tax=Helicobacter trogontum TaxID=50960 RepID=UPI00051DFC72|nr:hypothetical protein [Helicobacter trogontum]MDY5184424.1 hypothetical protein [Helicobacter trogontum]